MATETGKVVISKFPLRLMPSVRRTAEAFSDKEGVSLNQFINLAVAEKLAHLQHEEWIRERKKPTQELAGRALKLLDKAGNDYPDPEMNCPRATIPFAAAESRFCSSIRGCQAPETRKSLITRAINLA